MQPLTTDGSTTVTGTPMAAAQAAGAFGSAEILDTMAHRKVWLPEVGLTCSTLMACWVEFAVE